MSLMFCVPSLIRILSHTKTYIYIHAKRIVCPSYVIFIWYFRLNLVERKKIHNFSPGIYVLSG